MPLEYTLIRSKRRTVALVVQPDASLLVRAPLRLPERQIREWLESKQDWIAQKQAEARAAQHSAPPPKRFASGEKFAYLGQFYPLEIVERARPALALEDGHFRLARAAQAHGVQVFEKWYRAQAAKVLPERVQAHLPLFALFGYRPSKVRISGARTRWGSCSSSGTLSFTWRLMASPPEVIDYVVLHELAHLRIKNHSKQFWGLVKSLMPDYAKRRAWLKANGEKYAHLE